MISIDSILKKPVDYTPEIKRIVQWNALARGGKHDFSTEAVDLQGELIYEEATELLEAELTGDAVAYVSELCDLVVVTSYFDFLNKKGEFGVLPAHILENIDELSIDFKACLNAVITSNESKFTSLYTLSQEGCIYPYIRDMCKWIEDANDGRYKNVAGNIVNETHVVYRADGGLGKIVKPSHYIPHDLTSIIERALK